MLEVRRILTIENNNKNRQSVEVLIVNENCISSIEKCYIADGDSYECYSKIVMMNGKDYIVDMQRRDWEQIFTVKNCL
jgi:hypothetical protein